MIVMWVAMLVGLLATACAGVADPGSSLDVPTPTASSTSIPVIPTPTVLPSEKVEPTQAPTPNAQPDVPRLKTRDVELAFPNLPELDRMVNFADPDDGSNRLFVLLQPGQVVTFLNDPNVDSVETFLDIEERVNSRGNEEGLLGIAFDLGFASNGYFYLYYTAGEVSRVGSAFGSRAVSDRRSVLSRFSVSDANPNIADPNSEKIILEVAQPFANHNGGQIAFGPDGYLYIGLGDGGSGGDPKENGQNLTTLLGNILRIDVSTLDSDGVYSIPFDNPFVGAGHDFREEIWAFGFRNPWRFSFDRDTGDLWAADVGQQEFEEVDIVRRGANYGWNVMEGLSCFVPPEGCDQQGLTLPVALYSHNVGCSITGGYVYRGKRLKSLVGAYVFGDFCSGKIWAVRHDGNSVIDQALISETDFQIPSFGEDSSGEIYILSFDGHIYRFASDQDTDL